MLFRSSNATEVAQWATNSCSNATEVAQWATNSCSNATEVAQWATPSYSRVQPATDNGVRYGRYNYQDFTTHPL